MGGMLSRHRREQIIMALMGDAMAYRIPRQDGGVGNKWRCGGSTVYSVSLDRLVDAGYVMVRGDVATLTEAGREMGLKLLEQTTSRIPQVSAQVRLLKALSKPGAVTHIEAGGLRFSVGELDLAFLSGYIVPDDAGTGWVLTEVGREVLDRDAAVSTGGQ